MSALSMPLHVEDGLNKPYDQFILFGDSITEGSANQESGFAFHPALQNAYRRRLDVINRGLGGYTTATGVKAFPNFFPKPETATVRFMIIFFGANDATAPGQWQHVPLEEYKENLKKIIQHPATVAQNPRIILLTPPPLNQYQRQDFVEEGGKSYPKRTAMNTKLYADAAREVAASLGIATADIWSAFMKFAGWHEGEPLLGSPEAPENEKLASLLSDGLHFTPAGYKAMYDEIMKAICTNWPDQAPENLGQVFPDALEAPK